jgi:hypothetical protein
MGKKLLKFTLPVGMLIYAAYTISSRYVQISDTVSTILCYTSVALLLTGIAYHGWCFGKGKSPYAK